MSATLLSLWTVPRLNSHSNPSSTHEISAAKNFITYWETYWHYLFFKLEFSNLSFYNFRTTTPQSLRSVIGSIPILSFYCCRVVSNPPRVKVQRPKKNPHQTKRMRKLQSEKKPKKKTGHWKSKTAPTKRKAARSRAARRKMRRRRSEKQQNATPTNFTSTSFTLSCIWLVRLHLILAIISVQTTYRQIIQALYFVRWSRIGI